MEREPPAAHEAAGSGIAHEERRDDELQLVGEVTGEELGEHLAATLDHQTPHPPVTEVGGHAPQVDLVLSVDHRGSRAEPSSQSARGAAGAVDELLAGAGGEEPR